MEKGERKGLFVEELKATGETGPAREARDRNRRGREHWQYERMGDGRWHGMASAGDGLLSSTILGRLGGNRRYRL